MKYETASDRGRAGFNAVCPERGCNVKAFGTDKGKAKKAIQDHDKKVHQPERDKAKAAAQEARDETKAERKAARDAKKSGGVAIKSGGRWEIVTDPKDSRLNRKQKRTIVKARVAEMKDKVGSHNAKILEQLDDLPVGRIPQIKGLHTYGLPNIPDGQNINGKVYDKDGSPVTYDVLRRYVQGWGD